MTLSHTVKGKKRRYSYYICLEDQKRNYSTCPIRRIPAEAFEKLVLSEIGTLFQTPTMLAELMRQDDFQIPTSVMQEVLKNIYGVWEVMCPAERCKLMQAIITRITVYEDRITIEPNIAGLNTLLAEAGMEKKDEQN